MLNVLIIAAFFGCKTPPIYRNYTYKFNTTSCAKAYELAYKKAARLNGCPDEINVRFDRVACGKEPVRPFTSFFPHREVYGR